MARKRCWMLEGFIALILLLIIGGFILFLRRRAKGQHSLYKLTLLLTGIALAALGLIRQDTYILENLTIVLLVALTFELSTRVNPENISFKPKNIKLFAGTLFANIIIVGIIASVLLKIEPLHAVLFALLLTAIEYFLVDELREEGDIANPLIILFLFSIIYYSRLDGDVVYNIAELVKQIFIGIATGGLAGIIVFKLMNRNRITWMHELGLLCSAFLIYLLAELLSGSGVFAVMTLGVFFGNSFVRKKNEMKSFSPFIFKSLEILAFITIGFLISFSIDFGILWKSALIFIVYLLIRFIIISVLYKGYSLQNNLILTIAPKGIMYAILMTVLSLSIFEQELTLAMMYILIYSLIIASIAEFIEGKKIEKIEKLYHVLKNIRYGRKRDLHKRHI